ncbi:prolyl aminopeptidase [Powellomyces hirtus]|uniref:Proline iminopeptidase n=1 Tax=Powellomyces hirtus TaxID=109895 RepID=A0A507ECN4_9FUNG|nr:prolyl aminopeptidase [Powellomyces hirtus]
MAVAAQTLRKPYPPIEPYESGHLKVSDIHSIYWEVSGNPEGKPVVYLHGGPGGGTSAEDRRYFDPAVYKIVVFDQRGAGKSTPHACLEDNNTWALVSDIEALRAHLKIDKWIVFGGSWGSTLALSYAETHPTAVKALCLRGIFMLRASELTWFYQNGASHLFPDIWDNDYLPPIPESERDNLMAAYYRRLTGSNTEEQLRCAKAWSKWECATSKLYLDPENIKKAEEDKWAVAFARIECHYFVNKGFFDCDDWILKNLGKIKHLPCVIVQGRYDVVCPARSAWDLKKRWPEAELHIVADAGHSAKEPGITAKLVEAMDKFRDL